MEEKSQGAPQLGQGTGRERQNVAISRDELSNKKNPARSAPRRSRKTYLNTRTNECARWLAVEVCWFAGLGLLRNRIFSFDWDYQKTFFDVDQGFWPLQLGVPSLISSGPLGVGRTLFIPLTFPDVNDACVLHANFSLSQMSTSLKKEVPHPTSKDGWESQHQDGLEKKHSNHKNENSTQTTRMETKPS